MGGPSIRSSPPARAGCWGDEDDDDTGSLSCCLAPPNSVAAMLMRSRTTARARSSRCSVAPSTLSLGRRRVTPTVMLRFSAVIRLVPLWSATFFGSGYA